MGRRAGWACCGLGLLPVLFIYNMCSPHSSGGLLVPAKRGEMILSVPFPEERLEWGRGLVSFLPLLLPGLQATDSLLHLQHLEAMTSQEETHPHPAWGAPLNACSLTPPCLLPSQPLPAQIAPRVPNAHCVFLRLARPFSLWSAFGIGLAEGSGDDGGGGDDRDR